MCRDSRCFERQRATKTHTQHRLLCKRWNSKWYHTSDLFVLFIFMVSNGWIESLMNTSNTKLVFKSFRNSTKLWNKKYFACLQKRYDCFLIQSAYRLLDFPSDVIAFCYALLVDLVNGKSVWQSTVGMKWFLWRMLPFNDACGKSSVDS